MGDSSLVPFDREIADEVVFKVLQDKQIDFQFPPKIISDTNSASFEEKDIWSIEFLRIHKGSVGRRIQFKWEYVATDSKFNGPFIARTLRDLKSYFFEFQRVEYPVIEVDYTEIVPTVTYFRLRDVNIQHGDELVRNGGRPYPLHTKVSATLELATSLNHPEAGDNLDKVNVAPVNRPVDVRWY